MIVSVVLYMRIAEAANGIKKVCEYTIKSKKNLSEGEAVALFVKVQKERYATDVLDRLV